jgi:hypothetical protein
MKRAIARRIALPVILLAVNSKVNESDTNNQLVTLPSLVELFRV